MDLLETILRTANAEKYLKNFESNYVDTGMLKLLNEEDLKLIGVDDAEARNSILNHIESLQIPCEKKIELTFDEEYILYVLEQTVIQLKRHIANLSCANLRNDVVICDVPITPAVECLNNCVSSLEKQLTDFENKIISVKEKKKRKVKNILFPTIAATGLILLIYVRCFIK